MSGVVRKKINKHDQKLANKKASEISFKSKLTGPISELSFLRKSLLFAEVSMMSYLPPSETNKAAGKLGFVDGKFFDRDGSQAYLFYSKHDAVVVCRGTEANEWNDIKADVNAISAVAETVGRVHRGFKTEADDIWPFMEEILKDNELPLWFCGHSLGGAMATICAGRCMVSPIRTEPEELYTYGSPRVGDKAYVKHVKLEHYRWVNNNDVVTRVPPTWLGYRHSGKEIYLNNVGAIQDIKGWRRVKDRLSGFLSGLTKFKIDQLSDHSTRDYIDHIFSAVRKEEAVAK
jgi:triacylglycerol lipase